jgi:two-component system, response regulator
MDDAIEILLVEDDPRDVRLLVRELQHDPANLRVQVVRDGEEALDFLFCRGPYANRSPEYPPKLVLLDLKLPKIDGLQVLRELKSQPETKPIPVVAWTSSREERDRIESYRLGVNSYIQKPLDFDKFRQTIQLLRTYWLAVNQPPPIQSFLPAD